MTLSLTQVFKVRLSVADRMRLMKIARKRKVSASALVRQLIQQVVAS